MAEAIILAAGVGSRLSDVHGGRPKCLMSVAGRPILEWQLRALIDARVEHVVIVTGYQADDVREAVAYLDLPLEFSFLRNPNYRTTNVLSSWLIGAERLSDDHFYMHGDTIFEPDLLHRLAATAPEDAILLSVDQHDCGAEEMKVVNSGPDVRRISKQLEPTEILGEFTGVLHAPGPLLPELRALSEVVLSQAGGNKAFFEAALQHGIDQGSIRVRWVDVTGLRWREVDFPRDLAEAQRLFERGG